MINTKFSIVIPVYNTKKEFIEESVNSALSQTYKNYEIIIINDGSNQETSAIINSYKNVAKVINQENKGLIRSRLVGLENATGDYIVFLDSDDVIADYSLYEMNEVICKYDVDVILHDPTRFTRSIDNMLSRNKYFDEGIVTKQKALEELCSLHINSINNKFVKKELYKDIDKFIDSNIINGEDLQQSTYILLKANSFYCIEKKIYFYRMNIGHRDYYDPSNIYDINFLLPTYKMLFEDRAEYDNLIPLFKKAAVNSIIFNSFRVSTMKTNHSNKCSLLNAINNLEITKKMKNTSQKIPFVSSFLFFLLVKKLYLPLMIAAYIYKIIFGIDNI